MSAGYGHPEHRWEIGGSRGLDCKEQVVCQLRAADRVAATNNSLGGDPCPGVGTVLLIEFAGPAPLPLPGGLPKLKLFKRPEDVPSAPRWIAFVGHAEAGHNVDFRLLDNPDNGLTDTGEQQAREAASGSAGAAVRSAAFVIASPPKRALQTTGHLLAAGARPRVRAEALGTERRGAACDAGAAKSELPAKLPPERSPDWEGWDVLEEQRWPEPGEDMWGKLEKVRGGLRSLWSLTLLSFDLTRN